MAKTQFDPKNVYHTVPHVFYYIPSEESATGFEIPIDGELRIVKEKDGAYVNWLPSELTLNDMMNLYTSDGGDMWTIIEDVPDVKIDVSDMTLPELLEDESKVFEETKKELLAEAVEQSSECMVKTDSSKKTKPARPPLPVCKEVSSEPKTKFKSEVSKEESKSPLTAQPPSPVKQSTKGSKKSSPDPQDPKKEPKKVICGTSPMGHPIHFPIAKLRSLREQKFSNKASIAMVFYLSSDISLPPLHFHDGGATVFTSQLRRFCNLVRSGTDLDLIIVEDFSKFDLGKSQGTTKGKISASGAISDAVGDVIGGFSKVTKFVKSSILQTKPLLEYRPGTQPDSLGGEEDDEQEVEAATLICRHNSNIVQTADPEASLLSDYQLVEDVRGFLPPLPHVWERGQPLTREEWESYRDFKGKIVLNDELKFRAKVFRGGIENGLRREVWKYLFGYFKFRDTDLQRMEMRQEKEDEYFKMKKQWESLTDAQLKNFSMYRESASLISKDVLRTDRSYDCFRDPEGPKMKQLEDVLKTYLMYNIDLGYVQGMSDLLAPILVVMDNEIDAFWCFVGYMDLVHKYFEKSQQRTKDRLKVLRLMLLIQERELYEFLKGTSSHNMYFAFRWLLVNFKREFTLVDTMRIWEAILSGILSTDYALFIALAILGKEKEALMKMEDPSAIIKHVNELSGILDVNEVLSLAECYCVQLLLADHLPDELRALLVPGGKEMLFTEGNLDFQSLHSDSSNSERTSPADLLPSNQDC